MADDRPGGAELTIPVGDRDHVAGNPDSPVTLVEYGDFQCPQCGEACPIVRQVRKAFGARIRYVFRHFPLTNIHPDAQRAAEAAEWAATFGKFWEMHDALYDDQAHISARAILEKARALGLDPHGLEQAWATHTFVPRVKEDFLGGIRSGVSGTPTFFINGVIHQGEWTPGALSAAIEEALARSQRSG
jgi:protein-disulfide isomerase